MHGCPWPCRSSTASSLIREAAEKLGTTVSDHVTEPALQSANQVLADQRRSRSATGLAEPHRDADRGWSGPQPGQVWAARGIPAVAARRWHRYGTHLPS
jgi:hypothetical protein